MIETINFKLKNILTLFELLYEIKQKDIQYLKQLYLHEAENFEDCINFLLLLDLIAVKSSLLEPTPILHKFLLKRPNEKLIKEFLLYKILNKNNLGVWNYLNRFSINDNKYVFKPHLLENLNFSKIRNLLIELELISYDYIKNQYEIIDQYVPYFIDAIKKHPLSPQKLKKILEDQNRIGYLAELEIINYEKIRLASYEGLDIEHTATMDTSAGYDIKSFTVDEEANVYERFIEVKAIPKLENRFYLTRNEIETSRKFGMKYFLYLLPVIGKNKFNLSKLITIQDPNDKIFNGNEWIVECEDVLVKKREIL